MKTQARLFARFLDDLPQGKVEWIGVRPARKTPMIIHDRVEAIAGLGLQGDRRCEGSAGSARQITIISVEYLQIIAQLLRKEKIDPAMLRRNIVVSGINLTALRHQRFTMGDVIIEASALCHPCSRMNAVLGKNGVAAMLGHGGLCAKIIHGGSISVGDNVTHIGPIE
ncbi:MAG: MOSC domain-containing protein YiiM [Granulosicoccus sp.]|jgi:MOSC domain-containing protein YiiM